MQCMSFHTTKIFGFNSSEHIPSHTFSVNLQLWKSASLCQRTDYTRQEIKNLNTHPHPHKKNKKQKQALTLSTFMIWNRWEISAVLAGNRDLPDTNLMKRTLSSFENSSRVCQNHCTSWCCSSTSLYRTTFFRTSTDISGIPQTICSNCLAVRRDNKGTGTIQDIPSLTAATYCPKKEETFHRQFSYFCLLYHPNAKMTYQLRNGIKREK